MAGRGVCHMVRLVCLGAVLASGHAQDQGHPQSEGRGHGHSAHEPEPEPEMASPTVLSVTMPGSLFEMGDLPASCVEDSWSNQFRRVYPADATHISCCAHQECLNADGEPTADAKCYARTPARTVLPGLDTPCHKVWCQPNAADRSTFSPVTCTAPDGVSLNNDPPEEIPWYWTTLVPLSLLCIFAVGLYTTCNGARKKLTWAYRATKRKLGGRKSEADDLLVSGDEEAGDGAGGSRGSQEGMEMDVMDPRVSQQAKVIPKIS